MKKTFTLIISLCIALMLQAQVLKTVGISAGGLSTTLSATEKSTVTNLTVTGTIDARDFKTMRDSMQVLETIDLSGTTVAAYTGTSGTESSSSTVYAANVVPINAFYTGSGYNIKTTSISLPSFVTSIGTYAFGYCVKLTSVTIPSTVTSIGNNAFCYCSKLLSVTIPSLVTSIGSFAFGNCTSLTSIAIPASVTSIGSIAFIGCNGLTTPAIAIPASVTSIGARAFAGCNGLINVDAGNPNYSSITGVLFNKAQTTLIQCLTSKAGSYTIPSTVVTIETYAFYNCSNITGIVIPSSVTTINTYAFTDCSGLISVNIPSTVTSIGYSAFNTSSGLISVDAGNPNYSAADGLLFNKAKTTLIACPTSKTGSYAIPSTVTMIGEFAFENCALNSLTIPSSVISIAGYAFFGCSELISIYSNRPVPLDISSSSEVFFAVDLSNCTLYVPAGSLSAYKAADQWKDFTHIIEGDGFWLSASTISLSNSANSSAKVAVASNTTWTPSIDQSWITINPNTQTAGNDTIVITCSANPTAKLRTANVTISASGVTSQIITITQAAADPILTVSANALTISASANNTKTVDITSNTDWLVSSNQNWLTISSASGSGNATITFTATANSTIEQRTATITISATGVTAQTITFTQSANSSGITNIAEEDIKIYPNPANNILYFSPFMDKVIISIFDLNGKMIFRNQINDYKMNISNLKHGVYTIKIEGSEGIVTKKFLKE